MRKTLGIVLCLPFAALVFLAIAGAFVALFGGMFGLEDARVFGGSVSGIGALGFFMLLLSPYAELCLALTGSSFSSGPTRSNGNGVAPSKTGFYVKKDI